MTNQAPSWDVQWTQRLATPRLAAAGVILALLIIGAPAAPASAAGDVGDGCPAAFVPTTFEQKIASPKVQAGLAAGIYTYEQGVAGFAAIDSNGNGVICVQDIAQRTENAAAITLWAYFDNVFDDALPAHS